MARPSTRWLLSAVTGASMLLFSTSALADEPGGGSSKAEHWYEDLDLRAFVDGYIGLNFGFPAPRSASATAGESSLRAFDASNGFALHWIGLDLEYEAEHFGATLNLRFGPSASIAAGPDAAHGLENLKQAFVRWRPAGKSADLSLDFGKFDTPYGAEVSDTQGDLNYTRGVLYTYAQPVFHTGFRATWSPLDELTLRALLVNGWNDTVDENAGKTGGVQLLWVPDSAWSVSLGYLLGPEQPSTPALSSARLRHLVDLIFDAAPTSYLHVLVNADFGAEDFGSDGYSLGYGVSAAARLAPIPILGLGVRGEPYRDASGRSTGVGSPTSLFTGTFTLDLTPTPYFTTKLDLRLDGAPDRVFAAGETTSNHQLTMTLGAVAKTE